MLRLTELQTRILEALERYQLLTPSQLLRIGVSPSQRVIWRSLRHLSSYPSRKRPLVGVIRFSARERIEHVEQVCYLTPWGAEVLVDALCIDPDEVSFRSTTPSYHRDYWHRKYTIDFHIWLTEALEQSPWDLEVSVWDRYFDKVGANRGTEPAGRLRARTRIELGNGRHLIPDVNFVLRSASEPKKRALYLFEMTNGHDVKRVLRQIEQHFQASVEDTVSRKYGARLAGVLFLFSERFLLRSLEQRFSEIHSAEFMPPIFLGCLRDAGVDVLRCWRRAGEDGNFSFVTGRRAKKLA